MPPHEEKLLLKAQKGDEKAFVLLYQKYTPKIWAFVFSRVTSREAEDLVSLIWEKVIAHLKNFRPSFENSFAVWLFTIARNTLYNFYRKESFAKTIRLEEAHGASFLEARAHQDYFEMDRIRQLVRELPPQQSEVVQLKYFSDLKNKEIAQILKISEKTVASNLCRALKKLQQQMQ